MNILNIVLGVVLLLIILGVICRSSLENFQNNSSKGTLYLVLEAPGFNVPELNVTGKIMDTAVAQKYFNKVVVVANSAKYKNVATDGKLMTDQWNDTLVNNLGLPVEKWVFVCCSSAVMPASTLINDLLSKFPDIKGFLIDSEDDPTSIGEFVNIFKQKGAKYKYGIIGGLRKTIPPVNKYGILFDYFFSEVYTEGDLQKNNFYTGIKTPVDGATCVDMTSKGVSQFWDAIKASLGQDDSIIPIVCGSGDCQESLYGDTCFDERVSNKNINSLLGSNTSSRKNFAIWYGTGQQPSCEPSRTCLKFNATNCTSNSSCTWYPYKKNPNHPTTKGACLAKSGNQGCSTTW